MLDVASAFRCVTRRPGVAGQLLQERVGLVQGISLSGSDIENAAGNLIQKDPANAKVSLKIGSKNFTEQRVLGEIFAQGLAAAGYKTSTDLSLADENTAKLASDWLQSR